MGNQCLSTTPNQRYRDHIKEIKVSELKDLWQTVKIYKLKKIFDAAATQHLENPKESFLSFEAFKQLFVELQQYPQQQLYRLYEIFDFQNSGSINWSNFFSSVTILYFGAEKTLALIMFMMFDHTLEMRLDNNYLKLMLEANEQYIKVNEEGEIQEASEMYVRLMSQEGLTLNNWLRQAEKIIDFGKFRKLFNIFKQEKLQKELVKRFYSWNEIYNEEKEKYIGYLVNLKWFESWRLYIYHHYGLTIDIYSSNKSTIRTIKTCKNTYNRLPTVRIGIDTSKALHGCRVIQLKSRQETHKNIDCVHNHLGERPRQITNSQLQGQFEEVLREGVSQNMDYVIVSEKVWDNLKTIYEGYPEFRRTGYDTIELYPKIIKAYFSLFKEHIDYSTEVIREVSAYLRVDQLLVNSCGLSQQQLQDKVIYYKTIGMPKWEELEDFTYLFTELSSSVLIFLVCISKQEQEVFSKSHQRVAKDATEANVGDYLIYKDSKGRERNSIFMGKSTQGKYILHFQGELYTNDVCLIESQFLKSCRMSAKIVQIEPVRRGNQHQKSFIGLPSGPGLGFINSIMQMFMNWKEVKAQLLLIDTTRTDKLIYCLARLFSLLLKQARVQHSDIKDIIQLFLGKYSDFQVGMCHNFINDFFGLLQKEMKEEQLPNILSDFQIQIEKTVQCRHCLAKSSYNELGWALKVPLPEDKMRTFEIVWVPAEKKEPYLYKYFMKVKKQATLNDLMLAFEQELGIQDKDYILTEVCSFDIIKNYHGAQKTATLSTLKIRQSDRLYAYELKTNLNHFVSNIIGNKCYLQQQHLKKDMFVDCKHPTRGWIFGKVMDIEYSPIAKCSLVKVAHHFSKNQSWEISYETDGDNLARFPSKSSATCQQYHLRLQQRIFSESSNSMRLANVPLVVVLPAWMRWKEFCALVFAQVRKFIVPEYDFEGEPTGEAFKDYLASKCPYRLQLADFEGRCAICFKFLKLEVFKGESQSFCAGCQLSQTEPISWQVRPADLLVTLDWRGADRFKSDLVVHHPSSQQAQAPTALNLSDCLSLLQQPAVVTEQALCCNTYSQKSVSQRIIRMPKRLLVYLQRVAEEQDGFKRVLKRQVSFNESLSFIGHTFKLQGVTAIQGEHLNSRHRSYLLGSGGWQQWQGKLGRQCDWSSVRRACALVLLLAE